MKSTIRVLLFSISFFHFFTHSKAQNLCGQNFVFIPVTADCPNTPYTLVFEDNFDGSALDQSKWATYHSDWPAPVDRTIFHSRSNPCWREPNYFSDDNVTVANGYCMLSCKEEQFIYTGVSEADITCETSGETVWQQGVAFSETFEYTSGMIKSLFTFAPEQYVKIEAKIQLPIGVDFWPGFWMFSGDEIDIFEFFSSINGKWRSGHISSTQGAGCGTNHGPENFVGTDHIWTCEVNPYEIKYYLDNVLFKTVARYHNLSGSPIICNGSSHTTGVLENTFFPVSGRRYPIILDFSLNPYGDGDPTLGASPYLPASMKIDWVRVYTKKPEGCLSPDVVNEDIVIETGQNVTWDSDMAINNRNVIVEEGATLHITDAVIAFTEGNNLTVKAGGTLHLYQAIMTSCGDSWTGIIAESSSSMNQSDIDIKHLSKIENAQIGLNVRSSGSASLTAPEILVEDGIIFSNCGIGVFLLGNCNDVYFKTYNTFENCRYGIVGLNSHGARIRKTQFLNCSITAIDGMNSSFRIWGGNTFRNNDIGVQLDGTHPLAGTLTIGDLGQGWNFFEDNNSDIISIGIVGGQGGNIVNNRLEDCTGSSSTVFFGANQYRFGNNFILDNSSVGVYAGYTGTSSNNINCNEFYDNQQSDLYYSGSNNNSAFLNNTFSGNNHNVNVAALGAQIIAQVGTIDESATNCFSSTGADILSDDSFKYYYFDDSNGSNCQEPFTSGSYNKIETIIEKDWCFGNIGVFGRLNIPGNGGIALSFGSGFSPSLVCTACVMDSIVHHSNNYNNLAQSVSGSGNNSRSTGMDTTALLEAQWWMHEWVNFGVYLAIELEDYLLADQILAPLTDWHWQQQYFGLQIVEQDWAQAQSLLNAMPQTTTDQIYFKQTQALNLKLWQSVVHGLDSFTTAEISLLDSIAQAEEPSSAYANAIHRLITGIGFLPIIDDVGQHTSSRITSIDNKVNTTPAVILYPVPLSQGELIIEAQQNMDKIVIFDSMGTKQLSSIPSDQRVKLDVSKIPSGIYFVRIDLEDGSTHQQPLMIK